MAIVCKTDRAGRVYCIDDATGKRVARPRKYRVDTLGRGYWVWGDNGRRAPAPSKAPRVDRLGRPLDSVGRRIPAQALAAPSRASAAPAKGRPAKPHTKPAPKLKQTRTRPRVYRVDTAGRGYWIWEDTGKRAPKPSKAPRVDTAGRPLDSRGRRISQQALAPSTRKPPPKPSKKPPKKLPKKPPRKKAKAPVRAKVPARVRVQIRRASESVPGFHMGKGAYFTRPTESAPHELSRIFNAWLKGAVRKSPMASANEIGFRQFGVMFTVEGPLDMMDMQRIAADLAGQPVRLVFRSMGRDQWQIWMHANRPQRRTAEVRQRDNKAVASTLTKVEKAANILYDYLLDLDMDFAWFEYFETEDTVYEG